MAETRLTVVRNSGNSTTPHTAHYIADQQATGQQFTGQQEAGKAMIEQAFAGQKGVI
jgi:hypothetical protein